MKSGTWDKLKKDYKFKCHHTTPETSKELGHAESSNNIAELTIEAIMMEENMPQDHWQAAARSACFLLNRFPTLATEVTAPVDGDRASAIELATQGRYSRYQVQRELAYFVQAGRLALVHRPSVKGSSLEPKVRSGIAWGTYREQVIFRCPFSHSTFRAKSLTALELGHNINAYQFLSIDNPTPTRKSIALPSDNTEKIDIHLPKPRAAGQRPLMPVCPYNRQTTVG